MKGVSHIAFTLGIILTIIMAVILLPSIMRIGTGYIEGVCFKNAYEPIDIMVSHMNRDPDNAKGAVVVTIGDCIDKIIFSGETMSGFRDTDIACQTGHESYVGFDISKNHKEFWEVWKGKNTCIESGVKIDLGDWCGVRGRLAGWESGKKTHYYCLTYAPSGEDAFEVTCREMSSKNGVCK